MISLKKILPIMDPIKICEKLGEEVFYNQEQSNIIVRIRKIHVDDLINILENIYYRPKIIIPDSKIYAIINFEKTYPFNLT